MADFFSGISTNEHFEKDINDFKHNDWRWLIVMVGLILACVITGFKMYIPELIMLVGAAVVWFSCILYMVFGVRWFSNPVMNIFTALGVATIIGGIIVKMNSNVILYVIILYIIICFSLGIWLIRAARGPYYKSRVYPMMLIMGIIWLICGAVSAVLSVVVGGFLYSRTQSIGIIGGADGPTAIFVAGKFPGDSEDSVATFTGDGYQAVIFDGKEMILTLQENPTTGYQWTITQEAEIFKCDYDTYHSGQITETINSDFKLYHDDVTRGDGASVQMPLSGAGGEREFHIIPVSEGEDEMILQYKRSWENEKSVEELHVTLTIESDKNSELKITNASFNKENVR